MKPTLLPLVMGSEPAPAAVPVAVRAEADNPSLARVGIVPNGVRVRLDRAGFIAASIPATTDAALWPAGAGGVAACRGLRSTRCSRLRSSTLSVSRVPPPEEIPVPSPAATAAAVAVETAVSALVDDDTDPVHAAGGDVF